MLNAKKIGICFTGGGARGAYQIGALKALDALGIFEYAEAFSGSSIGSANAVVAASSGIEAAERVWLELPRDNIPKNNNRNRKNNDKARFFDIEQGLYSMDVFEQVVSDAIDFERLGQTEVYATISETGLHDGRFFDIFKSTYDHYLRKDSKVRYMPLHQLPEELVASCITASCSIPIFFSPVTIEDKKCYDGGMFDNVPVTPLVEGGCDVIIVIHLHRFRTRLHEPKKRFPGITFHEIRHNGNKLGRVLKFSHSQTERLLTLGYEETLAYFEKLEEID